MAYLVRSVHAAGRTISRSAARTHVHLAIAPIPARKGRGVEEVIDPSSILHCTALHTDFAHFGFGSVFHLVLYG